MRTSVRGHRFDTMNNTYRVSVDSILYAGPFTENTALVLQACVFLCVRVCLCGKKFARSSVDVPREESPSRQSIYDVPLRDITLTSELFYFVIKSARDGRHAHPIPPTGRLYARRCKRSANAVLCHRRYTGADVTFVQFRNVRVVVFSFFVRYVFVSRSQSQPRCTGNAVGGSIVGKGEYLDRDVRFFFVNSEIVSVSVDHGYT